jgi:hypothetical protein
MADLVVFVVLVGLIGAAGIALGMLAARRLGAWDERRAAAGDAVPPARGSGSARDVDPLGDGGDTVD